MNRIAGLLLAGIILTAYAAPVGRYGTEFLIDTTSTPTAYLQNDPAVAFDGTNYLVAWEDWRNSSCDIYAARVTPAGAVLDPTGFPVSTTADQHDDPAVVFDGTNFLVVWSDWRNGQRPNIYGARVTPGGVVLDSGIAISTAADDQNEPAVSSDGTNCLVAWGDHRDGSQWDLMAARVTPGGVVLDTNGIVVASATRNQGRPAAAFDGANTLLVWGDGRNTGTANDIYCGRVSPDGTVLDQDGIAVSRAPRAQWYAGAAFGESLFIAAWQDDRVSSTYDIYASRITSDGGVLDSAGIPLCTATRQQNNPVFAFDGIEFVAAWEDARSGANGDIYGARVTLNGEVHDEQPLAVRATGSRFCPALARGPGSQVMLVYQGYVDTVGGKTYNTTRIWCKLDPVTGIAEAPGVEARTPTRGATIVRGVLKIGDRGLGTGDRAELLDVSGRRVMDLAPGANDVRFLAPGVYFCRFTAGPSAGARAGDYRQTEKILLTK